MLWEPSTWTLLIRVSDERLLRLTGSFCHALIPFYPRLAASFRNLPPLAKPGDYPQGSPF